MARRRSGGGLELRGETYTVEEIQMVVQKEQETRWRRESTRSKSELGGKGISGEQGKLEMWKVHSGGGVGGPHDVGYQNNRAKRNLLYNQVFRPGVVGRMRSMNPEAATDIVTGKGATQYGPVVRCGLGCNGKRCDSSGR